MLRILESTHFFPSSTIDSENEEDKASFDEPIQRHSSFHSSSSVKQEVILN
jgi:hypothetical protein